ncbi:MAG: alpha-amylase family glycosyl hydrolase [Cyclobacteriaceae bacterium]
MKKIFYLFVFILASSLPFNLFAQKVNVTPTISPSLFGSNDQVTFTYDVTGSTMASLSDAWVWVWTPNNTSITALYNHNPPTSADAPAKCTKSVVGGKTLFTITFVPQNFFSSDISGETQMGILLKGSDWGTNNIYQTTDDIVPLGFQVKLLSPTINPAFVSNGGSLNVQASAPVAAKFVMSVNGKKIDSVASATTYSHNLIGSDSVSIYNVLITGSANGVSSSVAFSYLIKYNSPTLARPTGIIDGINYNPSDQTKVTLSFWAPNKTSVYAFGDFTNWDIDPKYLMNRDGEHFWVEITNLTPQQEYAFQYLVNDTLRIADPYTDKILETDDSKIPSSVYPNLKTIPTKALSSQWYYNHFSVFQTGQTPYQWQTTNYQKPAKEKLVIYELLIRDFFANGNRSFQTLIDTIGYFKRLGVNAIELMPVAEFNGEIGWGYNPTSMFAVQKYYGPKNKLKEFVDVAHANGIAVIMDLVMNHQDLPNSYAMLDYDFVKNQPKASNKWFNVTAPHPYSVFNDLNHASTYTRKYLDTINYYWINEFKIDGYRYDLSKGFTQTVSDVNTVGNYDQSRVDNLSRMANVLWTKFPDAYVILEHFAVNTEETALANYQVAQGRGMMLWENFNYAYGQNTMGYASGQDLSAMYYGNKGWTAPRAVGYMESHDEEREMYRNITSGNVSGSYSVKDLPTALSRMKTAGVMFYTIPGPKMLWEFGEMGYDFSINTCVNLSVNDSCRLSYKPVHWDYLQDKNRMSLWNHVSDLMRLRKNYDLFTSKGAAQISLSGLVHQMNLKNSPYTATPVDSSQMNAQVAVNFDVVSQQITINFAHAGTWYDYYNQGAPVNVSSGSIQITLNPGDYKLYTDVKIKAPPVTVDNINSTQDLTYHTGQQVPITIHFTGVVSVTGTPKLTLNTTPNEVATYVSGSGTNTLSFVYKVIAGDVSSHLDYLNANALSLNGGTIKDAGGNSVVLTLPAPGASGSLSANRNIIVAPVKVYNVTSTAGNATYGTGQRVPIIVNFTDTVYVSGAPNIALNTTPQEVVSYTSGSGTRALTFSYTVKSGDVSHRLDYLNATALALNGGTITDSGSGDAILALPTPGASGSLGANKNIVISPTTDVQYEIAEVNIYPNPAHNQLMVETDHRVTELQARSITGVLISPNRIDDKTWDVSSLSSGMYIIEINTDAGLVRKKLIKN